MMRFYSSRFKYKGELEVITPGKISGWLGIENINLEKIKFFIGKKLLAEAEINIPRPDVSEEFKLQENSGFSLYLPYDKNIDTNGRIKIIATGWKYGYEVKINLKKLFENKIKYIKNILKCDFLGVDGNIDHINQSGIVTAWVSRRNQKGQTNLWMHCGKSNPLLFLSNDMRPDIEELGYQISNGFQIDLNSLPQEWSNKEIFFSFDKEGNYHVPQQYPIIVPEITAITAISSSQIMDNSNIDFSGQIEKAPLELQQYWQKLEEFSEFLNDIEQRTEKLEKINFNTNKKKDNKKLKWLNFLENPLTKKIRK